MATYEAVLRHASSAAIIDAAERFTAGKVPKQSKTFPPSVAAFCEEVERLEERNKLLKAAASATPEKPLYGFKLPNSKPLEENCTRDWGRRLVDQGVHPRGSIWIPGPLRNDDGSPGRPDIGTLYGPDATWQKAKPLKVSQEPTPKDDAAARVRMTFKLKVWRAGMDRKGGPDRVAEANNKGLEYLMALGQEWGIPIPESLWLDPQAKHATGEPPAGTDAYLEWEGAANDSRNNPHH